jgi:hypothetical protein
MSNTTIPFLVNSQLNTVTAIASTAIFMQEIQKIIDSNWSFDYPIESGFIITGTPNDFAIELNQKLNYSGTIVPGVPAFTVTPAVYVKPVMSPAIPATPGWGTVNVCSPFGKCTTSVPGTPAVPATTITPGYTIPAVVTPAVPALTGGYSSDILVNVTVKGVSDAITPILESTTFVGTSDPTENSTSQTITYNLDSDIDGGQLKISGNAAVNNIVVTIAGVSTDLGSINTCTVSLSPVPDIPLAFNMLMDVPPYNVDPPQFQATANTLAYTRFPYTSGLTISDLAISTGSTAIADFIDSTLLEPLTSEWNSLVCPILSAVNISCPIAPTQTLANYISDNAVSAQQGINSATQNVLNSILTSSLGTIQTYAEPVIVTGWNNGVYTSNGSSES